jgi:hypothetical protein
MQKSSTRLASLLIVIAWSVGAAAQGAESNAGPPACTPALEREPPSAMSEEELARIRGMNDLLVNRSKDVVLDYSDDSIRWLDERITKRRENLEAKGLAQSAILFGSYLGEAIVRRFKGTWVKVGDEPAVLVNGRSLLFPMGQVMSQIQQGQRCSIYSFYTQLPAVLGERR